MTGTVFASFIDGRTTEAGEKLFDLVAPQAGKVIGQISEAGAAGVDRAVKAAAVAFSANRKQPTHQRIAWLKAAAAALSQAMR